MIGKTTGALCQAAEICNDTFDNDATDGIDCADHTDCDNQVGARIDGINVYCKAIESSPVDCFDGFDNDADGLIDCFDDSCNSECALIDISSTTPIVLPTTTSQINLDSVDPSIAYITQSRKRVRLGERYAVTLVGIADSTSAEWTIGTARQSGTVVFSNTAFDSSSRSLSGPDTDKFDLTETPNGYKIKSNQVITGGYSVTFNIDSITLLPDSQFEITFEEAEGSHVSMNNLITYEVVENTPPTADVLKIIPENNLLEFGGTMYLRAKISDDNRLGKCTWSVSGAESHTISDSKECTANFDPTKEGIYNIEVTPVDYYSNIGTQLTEAYNLNILPTTKKIETNSRFYSPASRLDIRSTFNMVDSDTLGECQIIARNKSDEIVLGAFASEGNSCNMTSIDLAALSDGIYSVYIKVAETTDNNIVESLSTVIFVCSQYDSGICKFADFDQNGKSDICRPPVFDFIDCTTITSAGTYYLTDDIIDSNTPKCIDIKAKDVILDCQGNIIDGNDRGNYGIFINKSFQQSTNILIRNCTISDWKYGIYLEDANSNTLENLTTNSNVFGIYSENSDYNTMTNIYSNENNYGIFIKDGSENSIIDSNLSNSNIYDFYIQASSNVHCSNLLDNVMGTDNKPIVYYDESVIIKDWNNNASEIILCDADNSIIENVTLSNTGKQNNMIYMHRTDNSNIKNVDVSNSYDGILLDNSLNNEIIDSTISENGIGISLKHSSDNKMINLTIKDNYEGIAIDYSSNNTIIDSYIKNSIDYGIAISESSNNTIYDNFFNNTNNINLTFVNNNNVWNTTNETAYDGEKNILNITNLGGNVWIAPGEKGFSNLCDDSDEDGICDSSYDLEDNDACNTYCSNNTDHLPLYFGCSIDVDNDGVCDGRDLCIGESPANPVSNGTCITYYEFQPDGCWRKDIVSNIGKVCDSRYNYSCSLIEARNITKTQFNLTCNATGACSLPAVPQIGDIEFEKECSLSKVCYGDYEYSILRDDFSCVCTDDRDKDKVCDGRDKCDGYDISGTINTEPKHNLSNLPTPIFTNCTQQIINDSGCHETLAINQSKVFYRELCPNARSCYNDPYSNYTCNQAGGVLYLPDTCDLMELSCLDDPDYNITKCAENFTRSEADVVCDTPYEEKCWIESDYYYTNEGGSLGKGGCCGDDKTTECWVDDSDNSCCWSDELSKVVYMTDADYSRSHCNLIGRNKSLRNIGDTPICDQGNEIYCWADNIPDNVENAPCCGDDPGETWNYMTSEDIGEVIVHSTCYQGNWTITSEEKTTWFNIKALLGVSN